MIHNEYTEKNNDFQNSNFEPVIKSCDPSLILEKTMERVSGALDKALNKFDAKYDEFEKHLNENAPELSYLMDQLWQKIDCDIYQRFLCDTLLKRDLISWIMDLSEWEQAMENALNAFESAMYLWKTDDSDFSQIFEVAA